MQFYQKTRENCVKTHVILKKASFYACLTLFAGMAFPMPLWASQSTAIVQQHVKQITGIVKDANGDPVIGANVVVDVINNNIKNEITKVQAQTNDTELQARLTTLQQKEGVLANFQSYKNSIANAEMMYNYMPKGTTDVYKMLREPFTAKQDGIENVTSDDIRKKLNGMKLTNTVGINGYTVTVSFSCTDQSQPSQYVRALIAQGYFENITYTGYQVEKASAENDNKESITFNLTMLLKAGNDFEMNKDTANSAIENAYNAGDDSDTSSGSDTSDTSDTSSTAE